MLEKIISPVCICCGETCEKLELGFCESCLNKVLSFNFANRCVYCSYPIPEGSNICGKCFKEKRDFDGGYFLFPYNECGRALIHAIKFDDRPEYLKIIERFKQDIALRLKLWEIDIVTYIPTSLFHYLLRGYSVPKKIAEIISSRFSIPLEKTVYPSFPYKKLLSKSGSVSERKKIVQSFFKVKVKGRHHKNILVVDDVFTTGTTLGRVAYLLKKSGLAEKVFFLTLAMVVE